MMQRKRGTEWNRKKLQNWITKSNIWVFLSATVSSLSRGSRTAEMDGWSEALWEFVEPADIQLFFRQQSLFSFTWHITTTAHPIASASLQTLFFYRRPGRTIVLEFDLLPAAENLTLICIIVHAQNAEWSMWLFGEVCIIIKQLFCIFYSFFFGVAKKCAIMFLSNWI